MMLTETCGCGAERGDAVVVENTWLDAARLPPLDEFRALHACCRTDERAELVARASAMTESTTNIYNNAPEVDDEPSGIIDRIDDPRLDPVIARRAAIGYTLDWDPYGPEEVPDAMRLDLVADWVTRVNVVRDVENRVPGDLRRIARYLRTRDSAVDFSADHADCHLFSWTAPERDGELDGDDPVVQAVQRMLAGMARPFPETLRGVRVTMALRRPDTEA